MDKSQFQQLKQYVGADLLNYALNRTDIYYRSDLESLKATDVQMSVLEEMYRKVLQCRFQYIFQGGYGDGADLCLRRLVHNGESIFSHFRAVCGGVAEKLTSDDPVIAYLQKLCIRNYPNLLLKPASGNSPQGMVGISIEVGNRDAFIELVKNDPLDLITNGKEGLDYAFEFTTEDGLQFNAQVCSVCTVLISRAFYDACNRMNYSLPVVLETIADYVNGLRGLAAGNSMRYSSFVGLKGVRFVGFSEIGFDGAMLRQYAGIENPGLHTQRTVVGHSDEYSRYSGHVLEVIHNTRIVPRDVVCDTKNSVGANDKQQDVLEKVLFSLAFSCESTRGPAASFYEIGFPLIHPGTCGLSDRHPGEYIMLDEAAKGSVKSWFGILGDKPLDKVKTPLRRLKYAIFERQNPEDAIVDAIIAWEGMFSEAFETTFKVTGSLAKYLSEPDERPAFLSRLKKLYQLRSDLVHGANSRRLGEENVDALRVEVVNIGLRCLKKLLLDEKLLPLPPSERVKHLLVLSESAQ